MAQSRFSGHLILRSRSAQPGHALGEIVQQTHAAELPARGGVEKIAVSRTRMIRRRGMRAAAQYHLIDHELAVVFSERTGSSAIAGIEQIGAARPLPGCPESFDKEMGA